MAKYVEAFSPRLLGVDGARDALAELATQVNVAFMKVPDADGGYTIDHTGNIVIVESEGSLPRLHPSCRTSAIDPRCVSSRSPRRS